jgi:subtilisin family serine protease
MDPLKQIRIHSLMNYTSGNPDIKIGIIDGPVELNHPAFEQTNIKTVRSSQISRCMNASSIACSHGTFVAGIICAKRGLSAPALCPNCQIILNPIFKEESEKLASNHMFFPSASAEELSKAIIETVDAGVHIINLSLGLSSSSLIVFDELQKAYEYTLRKGVLIVAAAGNQGIIGNVSLINHQWLIPVVSCDENGRIDATSNFGPSIGKRGLMAPGANITSASSGGGFRKLSGTSFATAFVTGSIALLWSLFPEATAEDVKQSLIDSNQRSIVPPLLNAEKALNKLKYILLD